MENGQCVIGMEKGAIIPLIAFDVVANVSFSAGKMVACFAYHLPIRPI